MTSFAHLAKTSLGAFSLHHQYPTTPLGLAAYCCYPISFLIDDLQQHPISSLGSSGLGHRHGHIILISFTHIFTTSQHTTTAWVGSYGTGHTEDWTRAIESRPSGLVNSLAKLWDTHVWHRVYLGTKKKNRRNGFALLGINAVMLEYT